MEPRIIQLMSDGRVDEVLQILNNELTDRETLQRSRMHRLLGQVDFPLTWDDHCCARILPRKIELDLKSSSWFPWRDISVQVKEALYELGLKNSHLNKKPERDSSCDNIENTLAEMKSLQQEMIKEIQRLNAQRSN